MKVVAINVEHLSRSFFYFDIPVNYKLDDNNLIDIYPINIKDSEIFLSSVDILNIDKNSFPDVKIIQMSYLQFIIEVLCQTNKVNMQKFINILVLCLKLTKPKICFDEKNKIFLFDDEKKCKINSKNFEDIRRIILYQNIPNFDDEYINPELKKAMMETDILKNKNIVVPNLERKIAIITAHTGISKKEQLDMTYRSHSLLFKEICEEIEYVTARPVALYTGSADKMEQWIYKTKKNKMDGYITSVEDFNKSMGGTGAVKSTII